MHRRGKQVRTARAGLVATASLAVLALTAACAGGSTPGGTASAGDGAQTLVLQTNWTSAGTESAPLHAALDRFTKQTGIQVKILENGDDLNQVYETSLLAGKEADVLLVGLLEKQLDWVKNGAVEPVQSYVDQWGLKDKIPTDAIADWTDGDGQLRGLPYAGFTWPWWYNTSLLQQAGVPVPTTVDQLIAAAAALRAKGIGPVAIGGNDWSGQKIFLQVMETYMRPDEAKQVFAEGKTCANADAMKGIDLFVRLRDAGVFVDGVEGLTSDQASALYFSGKAAISPMGSWSYVGTDAGIATATQLGGLPVPDGSTYDKPVAYNGTTSAGWWISPNGAKKLDAIKQLITFMYQPDVLSSMVQGGVVITTAQKLDTSGVTSPLLKQSFDALPSAVDYAVMPDLYVPADVSNPMYRATSIAFTKGNDAQTICRTVDDVYTAQ